VYQVSSCARGAEDLSLPGSRSLSLSARQDRVMVTAVQTCLASSAPSYASDGPGRPASLSPLFHRPLDTIHCSGEARASRRLATGPLPQCRRRTHHSRLVRRKTKVLGYVWLWLSMGRGWAGGCWAAQSGGWFGARRAGFRGTCGLRHLDAVVRGGKVEMLRPGVTPRASGLVCYYLSAVSSALFGLNPFRLSPRPRGPSTTSRKQFLSAQYLAIIVRPRPGPVPGTEPHM